MNQKHTFPMTSLQTWLYISVHVLFGSLIYLFSPCHYAFICSSVWACCLVLLHNQKQPETGNYREKEKVWCSKRSLPDKTKGQHQRPSGTALFISITPCVSSLYLLDKVHTLDSLVSTWNLLCVWHNAEIHADNCSILSPSAESVRHYCT